MAGPDDNRPAGQHPSGQRVLFEFTQLGQQMRVAAIDEATGTEVVVIAPFWGGAPFELLVLPTHHEGHFARTAPPDLVAVGRALRDSLALLREKLGEVSYNLVLHTLPHRASDPFHWHLHVIPRVRSVGAFEQGTGVPINIVAPERATDLLLG